MDYRGCVIYCNNFDMTKIFSNFNKICVCVYVCIYRQTETDMFDPCSAIMCTCVYLQTYLDTCDPCSAAHVYMCVFTGRLRHV